MSRSLSEIKIEISNRLFSNEYLPSFIERSEDLRNFCDSIGEFLSFYIAQLEDFEDIWNDYDLLKKYLISKHMYFNGEESLSDLQTIAQTRLQILADRGTKNMDVEIKRICNDDTQTELVFKDFGECGFVLGRTSPMYRESSTDINVCYLGIRELVVFDLYNQNVFMNETTLRSIIQKYFAPQHISHVINFI